MIFNQLYSNFRLQNNDTYKNILKKTDRRQDNGKNNIRCDNIKLQQYKLINITYKTGMEMSQPTNPQALKQGTLINEAIKPNDGKEQQQIQNKADSKNIGKIISHEENSKQNEQNMDQNKLIMKSIQPKKEHYNGGVAHVDNKHDQEQKQLPKNNTNNQSENMQKDTDKQIKDIEINQQQKIQAKQQESKHEGKNDKSQKVENKDSNVQEKAEQKQQNQKQENINEKQQKQENRQCNHDNSHSKSMNLNLQTEIKAEKQQDEQFQKFQEDKTRTVQQKQANQQELIIDDGKGDKQQSESGKLKMKISIGYVGPQTQKQDNKQNIPVGKDQEQEQKQEKQMDEKDMEANQISIDNKQVQNNVQQNKLQQKEQEKQEEKQQQRQKQQQQQQKQKQVQQADGRSQNKNNIMEIDMDTQIKQKQIVKQEVEPQELEQWQQKQQQKQQQQQKQKQQYNQQQQQQKVKGQKIYQYINQAQVQQKQQTTAQNKNTKHPQRIVMTEQNQPYNTIYKQPQTVQQNNQNKIVQFQQYEPQVKANLKIIQKQQPSIQNRQEKKQQIKQQKMKPKSEVPAQYQSIQNQQLLKRIQQLEETVKVLRNQKETKGNQQKDNEEKQENSQNDEHVQKTLDANRSKNSQKVTIKTKTKKQQIIHDQSVHGLVSQLAKTDQQEGSLKNKIPVLQQKRYKRRKLDLTALMDKNMTHASNIFNVTIGQILDRNANKKDEQQKQSLRKQIKQLRQKVLKLQQEKRTYSTQKPAFDTRRQTASTGKKSICGKLIKVSQLKGSRISGFEDNQSLFKGNQDIGAETKSQRDSFVQGINLKNKISNNSATQRQQREDNPNNLSFRVRRPSNRVSSGTTPLNQTIQKPSTSDINDIKSEQKINIFPVSASGLSDKPKRKSEKVQKTEKKVWHQQPFLEPLNVPDLPSPPSQFDSQQDLYTLGKITFIAFGINFSNSTQMNVKKYKNCVYFNVGQKNNILWYFDGRFYYGQWQVHLTGQGEKSGQGFEFVPGKFVYKGQFKQGKRNGFGKMKILGKEKEVMYEGNWLDGNKNGQGKQIDQYGVKYWGQWKENKREGFGRLKLEDGDYFQGNFQRGIKTGQGLQIFKNGDKYQGNYLANKFHGKGKYYWKNGSVYEGDFNHGIRSGNGKWKSSQNSLQYDEYEGEYENDKKNGYGKYRWADGSQYEGFFKDDLKQGQGTIRYKNGKVAKLLWRNGQPMKKIFSQQQKNYRQGQKSKQKNKQQPTNGINRNETISSKQFSVFKQQ